MSLIDIVNTYIIHNFAGRFNLYLEVNPFSAFLIQVLFFLFFLVLDLTEYNYMLFNKSNLLEFFFFLISSLFFFVILIKSVNLLSLFICFVGFSINAYLIIMTDVLQKKIKEVAIKYYYLSTFSTMLLATGIFLVFFIFGTLNLTVIDSILNFYDETIGYGLNFSLNLGLSFILLSFFFKLNLFPGH